jgi:hypothetical protein
LFFEGRDAPALSLASGLLLAQQEGAFANLGFEGGLDAFPIGHA